MDIIILIAMFLLMAGIALLFCNLLHLNPAEGMILAVFVIIVVDVIAVGLAGSYIAALIPVMLLSVGGLGLVVYRWYTERKISFNFVLSPFFVSLTCVFILSLLIYRGDLIQNIDELNLWAIADKYMCMHDRLYIYDGHDYIQGTSLFRYFFLKPSGFQEGNLYAVSGLLYWIGLLLPFGKLEKEKSPRLLLYILLMHIGLYSMYYYGSKTCGPELPLACWTGGLAGWWITRDKKKQDIFVLIIGLMVSYSLTTSLDVAVVFFVIILGLLQIVGDFIKDRHAGELPEGTVTSDMPEGSGTGKYTDVYCMIAGAVLLFAIIGMYGFITGFSYLRENMTNCLRCIVEYNMSLEKSDLNYTFIFNAVLIIVLLVAVIDREYQRRSAIRYILYSFIVSAIYIAVLIYGVVDTEIHVEEEYMIVIQRLIAVLVIYLFVMAVSWMLCEKRLLERKAPYIPGLILLVVFLYGVNADYLTNTTAAYPEKSDNYAAIQQALRECNYIQNHIPSDKKIYMINQGEEIASAEAKYMLGDQVSDFSVRSWQFSVNGGMLQNQTAPYETLRKLTAVLTKGKYRYVWIHKTDEYLGENLPKIMGDEAEEDSDSEIINNKTKTQQKLLRSADEKSDPDAEKQSEIKNSARSELISGDEISGGQLYKVVYRKNKAWRLKLTGNIVPYDTRKVYYRWNDIITE